jgi:hypothetical protein
MLPIFSGNSGGFLASTPYRSGALTPPVHATNGQFKVSHAHLGSGRRFVGLLVLEFPFPHFRSGFGASILGRDLKLQFGDVLCGECLHSRSFVL